MRLQRRARGDAGARCHRRVHAQLTDLEPRDKRRKEI